MPRYVIFIRAAQDPLLGGRTLGDGFDWEVRELVGEAGTGDLSERAGPTLAEGHSEDLTIAKHDAETAAEILNQQQTYIYNPNTSEPTPLPPPTS